MSTEVHQNLQVVLIHALDDRVELLRANRRRLMAVDVDDRELRARHGVLLHDERGAWRVVDD